MRYAGIPPLDSDFVLLCMRCGKKCKATNHERVGWYVGYVVPRDTSDARIGQCPVCQTHTMRVIEAPEEMEPPKPQGFDQIPTT